MTTAPLSHPLATLAAASATRAPASASRVIGALFCAVAVCLMRRRTRAQLKAVSPEILDDIGVSQADAQAEASKPFWQP